MQLLNIIVYQIQVKVSMFRNIHFQHKIIFNMHIKYGNFMIYHDQNRALSFFFEYYKTHIFQIILVIIIYLVIRNFEFQMILSLTI